MLWIRVLGPITAEADGVPIPLGGPRQRAVLALLVAARGQVVSVDRMIEDLWRGEPPAKAVASLQAYVSNLRRLLEPGRPPRTPARLLVSAPPGYAVRLPADAVDAWRFERLCRDARERVGTDPGAARALLDEALALWRGPAFAETGDEDWAAAEAGRLAELRRGARELRVAAALRTGDTAGAVADADQLTRDEPLREEGWRLHALALWGGGRQADALATLRRARSVLADELGLDPGPALVELETAILTQRTEPLGLLGHPAVSTVDALAAGPIAPPPSTVDNNADVFVGREAELAALTALAADARAGGGRVALVTGEAGQGKSTLLARLGEQLTAQGWLVVTGRCAELDGAPPAWPWALALTQLARAVPVPAQHAAVLAPLLGETGAAPAPVADTTAGRFRLRHAVWSWLGAAARDRPVAVVLDDLHWADAQTLALLAGAADELAGDEPAGAPLLLVAAFRPDENDGRLTEPLARLARRAPLRLPLTGLPEAEVARLVTALCAIPVDRPTLAALAERTGGNPFYVRESARLLDSEGALVAVSEVPEGVRDVLRRRLARLPEPAVAVLRLAAVAAVAGGHASVEVLVDAADTDEAGVLDALESGLIAGLLTEPEPGRVGFTHALVRDTVLADLSRLRAVRMHARLAAALERLQPDEVRLLAHHHTRAASAASAAKAVAYCVRAAELAERRFGHDVAACLLGDALTSFERIPDATGDRDARRVELLGRLLRAQLRAGAVTAARATRQRALDLAEAAGRDDLLVAAFTAWSEPTPWQIRPYGSDDERVIALLTRLLRQSAVDCAIVDQARSEESAVDLSVVDGPGLDAEARCRLLDMYAAEQSGNGDPRARAAAERAVALAERLGRPGLHAQTMVTLAREVDGELEWREQARLGAAIARLGDANDLPVYRGQGRIVQAAAAAVAGEPEEVRRLVGESLDLARAYRLAELRDVGECALGMLAHSAGDFTEAERYYAEAADRMRRQGSPHGTGYGQLAAAALAVDQDRLAEFTPIAEQLFADFGPVMADVCAAALIASGRIEDARRVHAHATPIRPDFFFSMFATFRSLVVCALDDRAGAAELYAALLPYRGIAAGVSSLSLAMRPVAHTLGELAVLLGRRDAAGAHFTEALAVARRWRAPHWTASARAALDALDTAPVPTRVTCPS